MSKPIVAVVGRPNVGKSTLFNKLCGQRLAIVEDTPGITRDRIFANCEWSGHEFMLVDTGACTVSFGDLADQMAALGKDMGMDIRVQREDTFQAMHRI